MGSISSSPQRGSEDTVLAVQSILLFYLSRSQWAFHNIFCTPKVSVGVPSVTVISLRTFESRGLLGLSPKVSLAKHTIHSKVTYVFLLLVFLLLLRRSHPNANLESIYIVLVIFGVILYGLCGIIGRGNGNICCGGDTRIYWLCIQRCFRRILDCRVGREGANGSHFGGCSGQYGMKNGRRRKAAVFVGGRGM